MPQDDGLLDELTSLRIDRHAAKVRRSPERLRLIRRGPAGVAVGLAVLAAFAMSGVLVVQKGRREIFPDEIELGTTSLMSPAQQDVILVAAGYVHTRKQATVAPKTLGRLARLAVVEGDVVGAGQVIAELETADPRAQLAQVNADVAAAEARVERARADLADAAAKLAREEQLEGRGAGVPSARQDAALKVAAAQAQIAAAQAEARAVRVRRRVADVSLDNTTLRAPFAGTIIRKLAEEGEMLSPQGAGVVLLASLVDLEVHADVSELQYPKIKVGAPAEILLDAFPSRRFRGQVSEIRQQVDRAKATITVKVRFTDQPAGVLPDMAAKVSFLAHVLDEAALKAAPKIVAPTDAIVDRAGRKVVFLVEDDRARERPVTLAPGGEAGGLSEIAAGLTSGARLVRRPPASLRDGAPIKEKRK